MERCSVAIVGAGIAGAATAWFLASRGVRSLALFEQERDPGAHSTGRNAAILRTALEDEWLWPLARESAAFYRRPPGGLADGPLIDPVDVYLAAPAADAAALENWMLADPAQPRARACPPQEIYDRISGLSRELESAFALDGEGVLDVHALLSGFLRGARRGGLQLQTSQPVLEILHDGYEVEGLRLPTGIVATRRVVLAAGAWAATLGERAGCPLPITPIRRHLLVTEPTGAVDPRWPVVWITGDEFYFRPESGGLLMSACDESVADPPECAEQVDDAVRYHVAEKCQRWLPDLADAGAAHFWSGARTFAADHRFVIGPDPRLKGLFWVAGLGGHGMSCAAAVGRLASEWIVDGWSAHPSALALTPDRLLDSRPDPATSRSTRHHIPQTP